MSAEQALAFVIFATVAAITPGPSNVMLMASGAAGGVLRGLPCLFGVGAGMALMMFVVAFGLGAIVLAHPALVVVLKGFGAAFLLWLSWRIARAPQAADASAGARPVGFLGAFAFQWLNPKSWLVSTSAAAAYLPGGASALLQASWIAGLFVVVVLACGLVWLAFGAAMRRLLTSPKSHRAFNATMGVLLACSVLLLLW